MIRVSIFVADEQRQQIDFGGYLGAYFHEATVAIETRRYAEATQLCR